MTPEPNPARAPGPLLSLQALRAVAALLVLLHHAGHDADALAIRAGRTPLGLDRFADLGFGVHLFFVISGFILLRTARGFGSGRGARVFAARRVVRVAPLYWLLTTLTLAGGALAPGLLNATPGGPAWIAGSYLFVPVARGGGSVAPVLGQGWTLDYEMFFYALFAVALLLPRRAAVPALAGTLAGLVVLGRAIAPPSAAVAVWTDGLLLEFLFGLGIALLAERGVRLGPGSAALALAAGTAGWVAAGPQADPFDGLALALREGVPAALAVAGCALGPPWPATRAVLALALVGDASYSLYLSHPFAVRLLGAAWAAAAPAAAAPSLYLAAAAAAGVGLALALHRAVERPMTAALGRLVPAEGAARRPILPEAAAEAGRRG